MSSECTGRPRHRWNRDGEEIMRESEKTRERRTDEIVGGSRTNSLGIRSVILAPLSDIIALVCLEAAP